MTEPSHAKKPPTKKNNRRRRWSDFLLLAGIVLLLGVALSLAKIALATQQSSYQNYLVSAVDIPLPPPPTLEPTPTSAPEPAPEPVLEPTPAAQEQPATGALLASYFPLISNSAQTETAQEQPAVEAPPAEGQPATEEQPAVEARTGISQMEGPVGAVAGPSAGPIVRLVIPSLKIDRAVVMVGMRRDSNDHMVWNTDSLFSTSNRPDLVGQTVTSANPGEGGNIVLIGHNYNNGWYANAAVFVNLQDLQTGSQIVLYTESGKEFRYTVQLVKKVPWQEQDGNELEKHHKYMWPTDHEQLTLVTCGGVNLFSWSARIYVVAVPAESQANH